MAIGFAGPVRTGTYCRGPFCAICEDSAASFSTAAKSTRVAAASFALGAIIR